VSIKNFSKKSLGIAKTHFKMLYFHTVRGADAGAEINNPRGAVRTRQNIPKPHRVRAVRGAVNISNPPVSTSAVGIDQPTEG